jgi:hypothetical protein
MEAGGTRTFSSIVFQLRQSRPSDGGPCAGGDGTAQRRNGEAERVSACSREATIGAMLLGRPVERRLEFGMGAQQSIWPGGARDAKAVFAKRHGGLARRAPSDVTPPLRSLPA